MICGSAMVNFISFVVEFPTGPQNLKTIYRLTARCSYRDWFFGLHVLRRKAVEIAGARLHFFPVLFFDYRENIF
jgi:hypothetical protein